jgi:CRISPR-associated protein Cas1
MPFAYVTTAGASIGTRGDCLVVRKDGAELASWPIHRLDGLVCVGRVHLTTPAMVLLLRSGVPTSLMNVGGRLRGHLSPPVPPNARLRLAQYAVHSDGAKRLELARHTVTAKLHAMAASLDRYAANYDDAPIREARDGIRHVFDGLQVADGLASLRGHEGTAAARYWAALPAVNRSPLIFKGRSRRPPTDEMNAALSFAYVLLAEEVRHCLESLGADPHIGYYHESDGRRPALALDIMEPLRHRVADRLVLRLANLGQLVPEDFHGEMGVRVLFTPDGRQRFLRHWERGMSQAVGGKSRQGLTPRELVHEAC